MPGERDGACEAFDCAYRSPIRREAGVQALCANAVDARPASASCPAAKLFRLSGNSDGLL